MYREKNKHILEEPVAATVISHRFSHTVWGAVFAGVIMAIVTQMLLALLGSSIGLAALNVGSAENVKEIGIGAVTWWIISGAIALYFGGWVSGRMAGIPRAIDGMLHGLLSWGVATILMFAFLTTSLGVMIAGSFGLLKAGGSAVSSVAPKIAETFNNNPNLKNDVDQILRQQGANPSNQAALEQQLTSAVGTLMLTDNPDAQKQQIVNILVQNTNMSPADARNSVDRWAQNAQKMKQETQQKAMGAAETASKTTSKAALASFAMLLIGAVCAGWGGVVGSPHWSQQEIS
jgi:hypothetical protein